MGYLDLLLPMALSILFSVLQVAVKNPKSKDAMKRSMYKLYMSIQLAYPEFVENPPTGANYPKE